MPNSIKSFIKVRKDGNCALAVFQGMQSSFKNIHALSCIDLARTRTDEQI